MEGYIIRINRTLIDYILADLDYDVLREDNEYTYVVLNGYGSDKTDERGKMFNSVDYLYINESTAHSHGIAYDSVEPGVLGYFKNIRPTIQDVASIGWDDMLTLVAYRLDGDKFPSDGWSTMTPDTFCDTVNTARFVRIYLDPTECIWIPVTTIISFKEN